MHKQRGALQHSAGGLLHQPGAGKLQALTCQANSCDDGPRWEVPLQLLPWLGLSHVAMHSKQGTRLLRIQLGFGSSLDTLWTGAAHDTQNAGHSLLSLPHRFQHHHCRPPSSKEGQ